MNQPRYVRIARFCELTGYTEEAVRHKIKDGTWVEGVHFRKPSRREILMDLEGYEKWVERCAA